MMTAGTATGFSVLEIFAGLVIFTAWAGSLITLIFAVQAGKNSAIGGRMRQALFQWVAALFFAVWVKIPTFLATAGVVFVVTNLTPFYAIAFILRLASYTLFFRGMAFLVTESKFWRTKLPLGVFLVASALNLLLFGLNIPLSYIGNVLRVFHYAVILSLMAMVVHLLRGKTQPFGEKVERAGLVIFMFGWAVFMIADIQLALGYNNLPNNLWFINLISSPKASIGFVIGQTLILAGIVTIALSYRKKSQSARG